MYAVGGKINYSKLLLLLPNFSNPFSYLLVAHSLKLCEEIEPVLWETEGKYVKEGILKGR